MTVTTIPGRSQTRLIGAALLLPLSVASMVLWQVGVHVDVWYHIHYNFAIESFFTLPHALLYAGWAATSLVVAVALGQAIGLGLPRQAWLPPGYPFVLAGCALFGLGGAFDFVWHSLVGFEVNQEAVLAPSHLWLAISFIVSTYGLLRAAAERRAAAGPTTYQFRLVDLPLVLVVAVFMRVSLWFGSYGVPLSLDFMTGGAVAGQLPGYSGIVFNGAAGQIAGTMGILLHSVALSLFLVVPLRRLRLPGGAPLVIMLYEAVLIAGATDLWHYLPAVVGAALVSEALWIWIMRGGLGGPTNEAGYWLIGAIVPGVYFALYVVLAGAIGGGVIWTPHLWAGIPVTAAIVGLIAAVLAVPPRFVEANQSADAATEGAVLHR